MNFNNPNSNSQNAVMLSPEKEMKQREEIKDLVIERMDLKGITPNFTEFVKV
jgi:Cu/Ag efflux pump CusA